MLLDSEGLVFYNTHDNLIYVKPGTVKSIPAKYQKSHTSYNEFGEGAPVLTRSVLVQFLEYAGAVPDDARSFILLNDHVLSKFLPVYIASAECGPPRDDGKVLAGGLRQGGVDVCEDEYQAMPHCFWGFHAFPEWSVFIKNTVSAILWISDKDPSLQSSYVMK